MAAEQAFAQAAAAACCERNHLSIRATAGGAGGSLGAHRLGAVRPGPASALKAAHTAVWSLASDLMKCNCRGLHTAAATAAAAAAAAATTASVIRRSPVLCRRQHGWHGRHGRHGLQPPAARPQRPRQVSGRNERLGVAGRGAHLASPAASGPPVPVSSPPSAGPCTVKQVPQQRGAAAGWQLPLHPRRLAGPHGARWLLPGEPGAASGAMSAACWMGDPGPLASSVGTRERL